MISSAKRNAHPDVLCRLLHEWVVVFWNRIDRVAMWHIQLERSLVDRLVKDSLAESGQICIQTDWVTNMAKWKGPSSSVVSLHHLVIGSIWNWWAKLGDSHPWRTISHGRKERTCQPAHEMLLLPLQPHMDVISCAWYAYPNSRLLVVG